MTEYTIEITQTAHTSVKTSTKALQRSCSLWDWVLVHTYSLIIFGLAPFAAATIFHFSIGTFASGAMTSTVIFATFIGWQIIFWAIHSRLIWRQFNRPIRSKFGKTNQLTLNKKGFTLLGRNSEWHSAWKDVDNIVKTRKAFGLDVRGTVIAIPKSAFESPDAAFEHICAWYEAAQ